MVQKSNEIADKPVKSKGKEQGRPPGRGSIMWDTLTDISNLPLMIPIATMQSALPAVGTAVNRYGIYKSDPQARGRRTAWSMMRFLYDGGDVAREESSNLRSLHANIKGTLDDGSKYFALHPETFRIVPDTFLDAVVRIREDLGNPLSSVERDQLYEEYVQLCLMLGIPRKYIEPTIDDFYIAYHDLILNRMTYNETVQYLTNQAIRGTSRLKRMKFLQPYIDRFYRKYVYPNIRLCSIACLHPLYRERFDLPWSEQDERRYRKLCRNLRRFQKVVPRFLRYHPVAIMVMMGKEGPGLVTLEQLQKIEQKKLAREHKQVS